MPQTQKPPASVEEAWRDIERDRARRPRRRHRFLIALALIGLGLAAWHYFGSNLRMPTLSLGVTPIADIVAAPARFDGREVTVQGVVSATGELRLPGGTHRLYALSQDGAELVVLVEATLPARGQSLRVTGTVARPPAGQGLAPRLVEKHRERLAAR